MDILIQSVIHNAKQSGPSIHIRYATKKELAVGVSGNGQHCEGNELSAQSPETRMISYVIIHRDHIYLEPIVRSMFEGAEDVKIILDRRLSERRQESVPFEVTNRRTQHERRQTMPMLDILITADP
jgi:hypothetical protein